MGQDYTRGIGAYLTPESFNKNLKLSEESKNKAFVD
jgi:hypothetical protein